MVPFVMEKGRGGLRGHTLSVYLMLIRCATARIKCMCCPHTQVLHCHQAAKSSLPASSACVAHIPRFYITTKLRNPHYPHQVHVLPTYPGSTSPPSCKIPTTRIKCMCCPHTQVLHHHQAAKSPLPPGAVHQGFIAELHDHT